MAKTDGKPKSVRIRTLDDNEWRYDAMQKAKRYYNENRSDSVAYACEDVPGAMRFLKRVLERDDLTVAQRQEFVRLANLHVNGVDIEISDDVEMKLPGDE
jgi:hypothetical protein